MFVVVDYCSEVKSVAPRAAALTLSELTEVLHTSFNSFLLGPTQSAPSENNTAQQERYIKGPMREQG